MTTAQNNIPLDRLILRNLQYNEDFARKVFPHFKEEYFSNDAEKLYYSRLSNHFTKFNALPSHEEIKVELQDLPVSQDIYTDAIGMANSFLEAKDAQVNPQWLYNQAEEFCKDRALLIALQQAALIAGGHENKQGLSKTAIPELLAKALSISFDINIGHNYTKDTDERYIHYTKKLHKIKFHWDSFNEITNGGAERGTLNCVVGGTGIGKSIFLCDLAANYVLMGYKVLYISLEMSEMNLAQRIDANIMNVNINEFEKMGRETWDEKTKKMQDKCKGELVFKQYPNGEAHAGNFRALLLELKQKQNFIPDIVLVDYINICGSSRLKKSDNSYGYLKSVAEELRALMVEQNIVGWTGVQFNRGGNNNSDADITNTAESMGVVHTLDFLVALIVSDDLINMGQIMVKQLKTRYGDISKKTRFNMGLDRSKMRIYELANSGLAMAPNVPAAGTQRPSYLQPKNTTTPTTPTKPTTPTGKGIKV